MSVFGESAADRRDKSLGLAGLLAGVQSLRILAERGIATQADIDISLDGILEVMDGIPEGTLDAAALDRFYAMLEDIRQAAHENSGNQA